MKKDELATRPFCYIVGNFIPTLLPTYSIPYLLENKYLTIIQTRQQNKVLTSYKNVSTLFLLVY